MLPLRFNSVVKGYIHTYVIRNRYHTQKILERSALYFPLFESFLKEKGLPLELSCLPILESALNPHATSTANAVGLWQFMPATAKDYGLQMNVHVDERKDPHRSTWAAVTHLDYLYQRFGDWALALAAYNSGAGRVSRAIKRAQSNDFWQIRKFLPKETRNYVPAFIAALYIWNYHELHGFLPDYPEADLQITDILTVFSEISLSEIGSITNVPLETLKTLNPSLKTGIIPQNTHGYNLILPRRVVSDLVSFLENNNSRDLTASTTEYKASSSVEILTKNRKTATYVVRKEDTPAGLCDLFQCSKEQLRRWNQLENLNLRTGQKLQVYLPLSKKIPIEQTERLPLPALTQLISVQNPVRLQALPFALAGTSSHTYHFLQPGESLLDVLRQHPHLDLEGLLHFNPGLMEGKMPGTGKRLRIK